ncbi:potassium transporter TrkG [Microtetraspora sp. NBRC 13810]|uniref:TrkH family potassium uptake protein n=1 Tax=Microtetraspora sp. NBRC 13810 TaxID=3030990 RepID=UPI0025525898|nr:potassium transporter TrkG [Microtetraspora sp. NBRC 13810]
MPFYSPSRVVVAGFGLVAVGGAVLLMLPVATAEGQSQGFVTALFTAMSAVCVTGLAIHDTGAHWSLFGQTTIMVLFQIGGFGIMTLASLLALIASGRLGLRARLTAQAETKSPSPGNVRSVVAGVAVATLIIESVVAVILTARFAFGYGESFGSALYSGIFHSISAFTNAGFALYPDSMTRYATDPWVTLPVAGAVVAGGLGFPVLFTLRKAWHRPSRWDLHSKITVGASAVLVAGGTVAIAVIEWGNPGTLGRLPESARLMAAFFHTVNTRSGGLNSVDIGQMDDNSWLISDVLMFIGAGSGSTGGGIKVTTFALLGFVILAELRGEPDVNVGHRRIPTQLQRQAITITLLSLGTVVAGTIILMILTPFPLDRVLFEVISAACTVGLSTGITADVEAPGHLVLTALMFIGRIGPMTLGTALALHVRTRRYQLPEDRPLVG